MKGYRDVIRFFTANVSSICRHRSKEFSVSQTLNNSYERQTVHDKRMLPVDVFVEDSGHELFVRNPFSVLASFLIANRLFEINAITKP